MVYNIKMCLLPIPTEPCPDEYQKLGELTGKTHTLCQYEKVGKGVCRLYQILELIVNTKAVISLLSLPIIYLYGDELMLSWWIYIVACWTRAIHSPLPHSWSIFFSFPYSVRQKIIQMIGWHLPLSGRHSPSQENPKLTAGYPVKIKYH